MVASQASRHTATAVLVIGSPEFEEAIRAAARTTGRRIVGRVDLGASSAETARAEIACSRLAYEEIVIEAGRFARLRDVPVGIRRRARHLFMPVTGATGSARSADPFRPPIPRVGRIFKRTLDIVVASLLLGALALPLAVVAIAILVDSPGGVVFRQTRVGLNGRHFTIHKLRTMAPNTSDAEHLRYVASLIEGRGCPQDGIFKLAADPRTTRVGRWLRRFSIDEVPQLVNVLAGTMSLIGPRPPLPAEVELYTEPMMRRLRVTPGITGLWQVSGRCRLSFEDMIVLDTRYCEAWTARLEIGILLRTPVAVLSRRGAA